MVTNSFIQVIECLRNNVCKNTDAGKMIPDLVNLTVTRSRVELTCIITLTAGDPDALRYGVFLSKY